MDRGWIRIYRALWDNKYWPKERAYTPAEAWIDMLLLASFKDTSYEKRGVWIDVKRGQIGRSIKGLADRWKWSHGKVERFLKELSSKNDPQIEYQKSNITTVITIINYEKYQGDGEQNGTQTETKRKPNGNQTETYNKVKNIKNEKKKEKAPPFKSYFPESWTNNTRFIQRCDEWDAFRKDKRMPRDSVTLKKQAKRLMKVDIDEAIDAIDRSIESKWQGLFPKEKPRGEEAYNPDNWRD